MPKIIQVAPFGSTLVALTDDGRLFARCMTEEAWANEMVRALGGESSAPTEYVWVEMELPFLFSGARTF